MDVHGINFESVRHFLGPIRGGHATGQLPIDYVLVTGEIPNRICVGPFIHNLLSSAGRVEGRRRGRAAQCPSGFKLGHSAHPRIAHRHYRVPELHGKPEFALFVPHQFLRTRFKLDAKL